jgi:hypothetical protein
MNKLAFNQELALKLACISLIKLEFFNFFCKL